MLSRVDEALALQTAVGTDEHCERQLADVVRQPQLLGQHIRILAEIQVMGVGNMLLVPAAIV